MNSRIHDNQCCQYFISVIYFPLAICLAICWMFYPHHYMPTVQAACQNRYHWLHLVREGNWVPERLNKKFGIIYKRVKWYTTVFALSTHFALTLIKFKWAKRLTFKDISRKQNFPKWIPLICKNLVQINFKNAANFLKQNCLHISPLFFFSVVLWPCPLL